MSESNGAPAPSLYVLPDELFTFADASGKAYALDIIDCHLAQNDIAERQKQFTEQHLAEHPDDNFWFLQAFADWLNQHAKVVGLRRAQLDALWHRCREEFALRKKKQQERAESILRSLTSTDSTPGEAAPSAVGS